MRHLAIGGSTIARTEQCPGWIKASKDIPKSPPGPAAIEGSMHHEVQEVCRLQNCVPSDLVGHVYKEGVVSQAFTDDDIALSELAYEQTDTIMDKYDIDEIDVEPFVQYIEDVAGGSIDLIGLSDDGKIVIIVDYKFGRVAVSAKNNKQLLFYLVCARKDPRTRDLLAKAKTFVLVIIQPRSGKPPATHKVTVKQLDAFEKKILKVIATATGEAPPLKAGFHCKYCPASPYCETRRFGVSEAVLLGARLKEDLVAGAALVEEVETWLHEMKAELYTQITRGVEIPGWKVVEKRASRKWTDKATLLIALKHAKIAAKHYMKTEMLTAPQTADAFKKAKVDFDLGPYIEMKSSGTTLVPEHHDGDAIKPSGVPDNLKKLMEK